jgi:hypothetical protein
LDSKTAVERSGGVGLGEYRGYTYSNAPQIHAGIFSDVYAIPAVTANLVRADVRLRGLEDADTMAAVAT